MLLKNTILLFATAAVAAATASPIIAPGNVKHCMAIGCEKNTPSNDFQILGPGIFTGPYSDSKNSNRRPFTRPSKSKVRRGNTPSRSKKSSSGGGASGSNGGNGRSGNGGNGRSSNGGNAGPSNGGNAGPSNDRTYYTQSNLQRRPALRGNLTRTGR